MYQLGVQDETLRRELCKIKNPSLAEFDTLLEAHALLEASEKQRNKTAQANMTKGPQRKSPPNPNKIRLSEEERKRRKQFWGKCYRCGAGDDMIPQCNLPANVTCNSCKCQGHITSVCTKSSSARASYTDSSADSGQHSPNTPASSFYMPQLQQFNRPTPELLL